MTCGAILAAEPSFALAPSPFANTARSLPAHVAVFPGSLAPPETMSRFASSPTAQALAAATGVFARHNRLPREAFVASA